MYGFPIRGEGMATHGKKYVEGKLTHPPHPKDGYALPDCKDQRAKRVLEFLISIFYPKKLARITVTVGNRIFEAYTSERVVDWTLVIRDTIKQLLAGIGKSKPTSICPYLLHLYYIHDAIQPKNKKVYMLGESFMRQNVEVDKEEQPADTEDVDRESLSLGEIIELRA